MKRYEPPADVYHLTNKILLFITSCCLRASLYRLQDIFNNIVLSICKTRPTHTLFSLWANPFTPLFYPSPFPIVHWNQLGTIAHLEKKITINFIILIFCHFHSFAHQQRETVSHFHIGIGRKGKRQPYRFTNFVTLS